MKKLSNYFNPTYLKISAIITMSFFVLSIVISNIIRAKYHCINANDFSIYQQAIYDIASGISWNPYLTIRNLHIFNDHVDPIIYLASLFVKVFGSSSYSVITFEWLWFIALLSILIILKRKKILDSELLICIALLVFSRSLLQGLEFVVHPTTWSMVPCFLLLYFVKKDNLKGIILTSIAICWFREIFPFMIVGLSGFYFFNKDWKKFLTLFIIGSIYLFIIFYIRPKYMGPTLAYGNSFVTSLVQGHIFYVIDRIKEFHFPTKLFIVYLVPLVLIIKWEVRNFREFIKHPLFAWLLFAFPMFFLHMLANRFEHHHSIPILSSFLSLLIFSSVPSKLLNNKKLLLLVLLPVMATSASRYTRMVKALYKSRLGSCVINAKKLEATRTLYREFKRINKSDIIIATGGLIPALLKPGMKLYQFDATTHVQPHYDYLAIEKNHNGDIVPMTSAQVDEVARRCRPFAKEIMVDDQYYLFMKGNFSEKCLGIREKFPDPSWLLPKEVAR